MKDEEEEKDDSVDMYCGGLSAFDCLVLYTFKRLLPGKILMNYSFQRIVYRAEE